LEDAKPAPQLMESVPDSPNLQTCKSCLQQTEALYDRRGDAICGSCKAVFAVAKVLYRSGVKDEAQIIATIAYAARHGEYTLKHHEGIADRYMRFDHIQTLKGVPFLRPKLAIPQVVRYRGHKLPKLVRLEVLSKFAVPAEIAELYRETLQRESLPVFTSSPGSVSWEYEDMRLVVNVGPYNEIHPSRLDHFTEYPQVYAYSFPMPSVIEALCRALIGAPRRPGTPGDELFASGLGDHGRPRPMSAGTLIPACVAWHVGEHDVNVKPSERRGRVAQMLNRHVLKPLGEPELWDSPYNPEDLVWDDAKQVGPRFQRVLLFLQDDESDTFGSLLPKAPV
jgi:hypothetical protein